LLKVLNSMATLLGMPPVAGAQPLLLPPKPIPHPPGPTALMALFWITKAIPSASLGFEVLPPIWKLNVVENPFATGCGVLYHADVAKPPTGAVRRKATAADGGLANGEGPKDGELVFSGVNERQPWFDVKSGSYEGAVTHCAEANVTPAVTTRTATIADLIELPIAAFIVLL
jgi:hypothetical protein